MIPEPPRAGSFLSLAPSGFHRIAFTDWGEQRGRKATVCVHGLTRSSRDFDVIASALSETGRVVCADVAGRGASDWLVNPKDYSYPNYMNDMSGLMAHIGAERVDWIGTSMGGLIGMMLAATSGTPIRKLVINDIGPLLAKEALVRICHYVGAAPSFQDVEAIESYLREVHAPFGDLNDEQWRHLAVTSSIPDGEGGMRLHYDPNIASAFCAGPIEDVELWSVWDRITCPVLVLRGENSDLLSVATADEMTKRGPKAEVVTIKGCGHAPALMDPDQIEIVKTWLAS
ncbi:alpha/beta hydrolase [Thalassospiraceae bacterium LMO-JJ14]|nr:alpha/beta hydrolase [Thalassospiraceae bacterium LMO-JJ14]